MIYNDYLMSVACGDDTPELVFRCVLVLLNVSIRSMDGHSICATRDEYFPYRRT